MTSAEINIIQKAYTKLESDRVRLAGEVTPSFFADAKARFTDAVLKYSLEGIKEPLVEELATLNLRLP
jgi:hypothetical protein